MGWKEKEEEMDYLAAVGLLLSERNCVSEEPLLAPLLLLPRINLTSGSTTSKLASLKFLAPL